MRRLVAHIWQYEFVWRLRKASGTGITRSALNNKISLLNRKKFPGSDAAARFNWILAGSLHAAHLYFEEEEGFEPSQARATSKHAFARTGTWVSRSLIKFWLWIEPDPFAGVARRGATSLAQQMWGDAMRLEERRTVGVISCCVLKCPFNEYFQTSGRPDITPTICEWDAAWMIAVRRSKRPINVELRSTLASGDACCEFAFVDPREKNVS
jgi:hypothetical protein